MNLCEFKFYSILGPESSFTRWTCDSQYKSTTFITFKIIRNVWLCSLQKISENICDEICIFPDFFLGKVFFMQSCAENHAFFLIHFTLKVVLFMRFCVKSHFFLSNFMLKVTFFLHDPGPKITFFAVSCSESRLFMQSCFKSHFFTQFYSKNCIFMQISCSENHVFMQSFSKSCIFHAILE